MHRLKLKSLVEGHVSDHLTSFSWGNTIMGNPIQMLGHTFDERIVANYSLRTVNKLHVFIVPLTLQCNCCTTYSLTRGGMRVCNIM